MKKIKHLYYALLALCITAIQLKAQNCGPYTSIDNCKDCISVKSQYDTICPGASYSYTPSITVPAGFTIDDYYWSPVAGVSPATGTGAPPLTTITPVAPTAPPCSIVPITYSLSVFGLAPEVVVNGDFSMGDTKFCSQYTSVPAPSAITTPTLYTVSNDAATLPGWGALPPTFYDHTTGTAAGSMLIGNGDANVNVIWQQDAFVCPGADYKFSFWHATLHTSSGFPSTYAQLYVSVIDAMGAVSTYGPYSNTAFDNWDKDFLLWTNPAGAMFTTATIVIHGGGPIPGPWGYMPWGTQFAIDDISFRRRCEAKGTLELALAYPGITGPSSVCVGSTVALTGCTPGGTWSSANTSIATVDALGNVTGVAGGTTTITYVDARGCSATTTIVVHVPCVLSGPASVCAGNNIAITSSCPGFWSCSGPLYNYTWGTTTPVTTGLFYGMSAGTATVYFTDPTTGCISTKVITVNVTPPPMSNYYLCIGTPLTITNPVPGGTWSSSNTGVATINPVTGAVTAIAPGATTITYMMPTGCFRTTTLFVYDCAHGGGVVGGGVLCEGSSRTIFIATGIPTGGTWSSSDTTCVTIDPVTGVATAVSGPCTVTITYTAGGTTWTTTITTVAAATACVNTIIIGGPSYYGFNFTSTCSGTATIYYQVFNFLGGYLGAGTTGVGVIPYNTIAATYPSAYTVCVYRVDCNGCTYYPHCCASVNPGPKYNNTGIASADNTETDLSVVPNPNTGTFTVTGNLLSDGNAVIQVIDLLGNVVYTRQAKLNNGSLNEHITLDGSLANGMYILKVKTKDADKVVRFSLNR